MAKLVDPDSLNQATEVVISTAAKTVQLLVAGNLDDNSPGKSSGVTLQALYSFLKEEWRTDAALNKFRFPLKAIFEAKFDWTNAWGPADAQTRDLIRDAGWKETDNSEYAGIISLGATDAPGSDQAYFQQVTGFDQTAANFDKTGEVNEAVRIFDGAAIDNRDFFKAFLREEAKLFGQSNLLVEQDLSILTYQAYRIPLANDVDIKVNDSDATIALDGAPYDLMKIEYLNGVGFTTFADSTVYPVNAVVFDGATGRWFRTLLGGTSSGANVAADVGVTDWLAYAGERQIGTNWYSFNRIVTGNNASAESIYTWTQYQARQAVDINEHATEGGTINGNIAQSLLNFLGDTLQTDPGVYLDGFNVNDQNRIEFFDITVDGGLDSENLPVTTTKRTFPFVAAGTLVFSANLVADAQAEYRMYFTNDDAGDNTGRDFDTATAITVNDNGASPIEGSITMAGITFDYDYDGNVQRGAASAGVDAPVTVVAIGEGGAEWTIGQFTITRATGLNFPVNANDELVYLNPV